MAFEKIEGTILTAIPGLAGGEIGQGRYAFLSFDGPGAFVRVGWDGLIDYATTSARVWFAGKGTTLRSEIQP